MNQKRTQRERDFSPLRDKTLANVLRHLFVTQFGYENKVIFAEAMIERILETSDAFVEPASLLKPGQMLFLWFMPAEHPEQAEGRIEGCEAHRQTSCNRTLRYALTLFALLRVLDHGKR